MARSRSRGKYSGSKSSGDSRNAAAANGVDLSLGNEGKGPVGEMVSAPSQRRNFTLYGSERARDSDNFEGSSSAEAAGAGTGVGAAAQSLDNGARPRFQAQRHVIHYDEVNAEGLQHGSSEIEELASQYSIRLKKNTLIPDAIRDKLEAFTSDLYARSQELEREGRPMRTENDLRREMLTLRRKHKIAPKKSQISYLYRSAVYKDELAADPGLERLLITKKMRSQSGVLVVSVIMGPGAFSCSKDCHYCPNFPGISRSYIPDEPTVERGRRNRFDPYLQFMERVTAYFVNGHPIDKFEVIVLGGTFSCYPPAYANDFIRDLYYAANTVFDSEGGENGGGVRKRARLSLAEEIRLNEKATCGIIGLTLETRPDYVTRHEIRRFRRYGVTRVQLGVQHTDDRVLSLVNRGCTTADAERAIRLLKDNCFKVDIHLMPDLPGSSLAQDKAMFDHVKSTPSLRADQWKIYPTEVTEHTKIKEWYDNGEYKPYADDNIEHLVELGRYVKRSFPRYIRINRFVRDFPGTLILGGNPETNLRQVIHRRMAENGEVCNCIRCMEVKDDTSNIKHARLKRLDYEGSNGLEVFLSFDTCSCVGKSFGKKGGGGKGGGGGGGGGQSSRLHHGNLQYRGSRHGKAIAKLTPQQKKQRRKDLKKEQKAAAEAARKKVRDARSVGARIAEVVGTIHPSLRGVCWRYEAHRLVQEALDLLPSAVSRHSALRWWRGCGAEDTLYGFLRLRLSANAGRGGAFPELKGCALIRELHVYGEVVPTYRTMMQEKAWAAASAKTNGNGNASSAAMERAKSQIPQHKGFGKQLMRAAERCAAEAGFDRIAVISGVGVREYYRKQGYLDVGRSNGATSSADDDKGGAAATAAAAASANTDDESAWIHGGSDGDDHSGFRKAGRADGGFLIKSGLQAALRRGELDAPRWQPCDIDTETGVPIARATLPAAVLVATLAVILALAFVVAGQAAHVARLVLSQSLT